MLPRKRERGQPYVFFSFVILPMCNTPIYLQVENIAVLFLFVEIDRDGHDLIGSDNLVDIGSYLLVDIGSKVPIFIAGIASRSLNWFDLLCSSLDIFVVVVIIEFVCNCLLPRSFQLQVLVLFNNFSSQWFHYLSCFIYFPSIVSLLIFLVLFYNFLFLKFYRESLWSSRNFLFSFMKS